MKISKKRLQAGKAANFDLFASQPHHAGIESSGILPLPDLETLQGMFHLINGNYFEGKLPKVKIEWSSRMRIAGKYYIGQRLIKLGKRYHEFYPEDIEDTLKHEMIHILYPDHGADFKREASRLGTSFYAKDYPDGHRPHKYIYICPICGEKYHRNRRIRESSCGKCSGGRYNPKYKLRMIWSVNKDGKKK